MNAVFKNALLFLLETVIKEAQAGRVVADVEQASGHSVAVGAVQEAEPIAAEVLTQVVEAALAKALTPKAVTPVVPGVVPPPTVVMPPVVAEPPKTV